MNGDIVMSKFHFLKYNDEEVIVNSESDAGCRNPIIGIENGVKHVITGNINHVVSDGREIEIGDVVYFYCYGDKRTAAGRNGIYGRGLVLDILTASKLDNEDGNGKLAFALVRLDADIDINKKPLLSYDDGIDYLHYIVTTKSDEHNFGHCILEEQEVDLIEKGIAENHPNINK